VVAADHHDHHSVAAADDLHRHVFLVFLGSAVPLPGPDEPGGSHEESPPDLELLFALPSQNQVLSSSGGSSHLQCWLTSEVDQRVDCNVGEREVRSSNVAPVAFLCDRARHERSGVQLA